MGLSDISVLVTTLNEAENLPRCLSPLQNFDEVIVIDSGSQDETVTITKSFGARVENFNWNGEYPKKRQWCLDNLEMKNDFIFFIDGDEEITPALIKEIDNMDLKAAGYFVKGQYVWKGTPLKHGLTNNKLVLFNRHKVEFPIVNDLDVEGMGEMEGHYQPVLKKERQSEKIGQLRNPMLHYAYNNEEQWQQRHERYAKWEAEMIKRKVYPVDPDSIREFLKQNFRNMPFRDVTAFMHSYIIKLGFLDGGAGYQFAKSRFHYYKMVSRALAASKNPETKHEIDTDRFAPEK